MSDTDLAAAKALARIGVPGQPGPPPHEDIEDLAPAGRTLVGPAGREDRERIAHDLHDTVLQNLYAAGLQLQRARDLSAGHAVAAIVEEVSTLVSTTLSHLREVVVGLEHGQEWLGGLRIRILAVAAASAWTLGFTPDVTLTGALDEVSAQVGDDVIAALSEMLSNAARHAKPSQMGVECHAGPPLLLRVSDNGQGLPASPVTGNGTGTGTGNLAARAARYGGSYALVRRHPNGATATWTIPACT